MSVCPSAIFVYVGVPLYNIVCSLLKMSIVVNHVELLSVSSVLQTSYLANLEKKERTS